jgi:hypothetical protein
MALIDVQTLDINISENIDIEYLTNYNININQSYLFNVNKTDHTYLEQIVQYIYTIYKNKLTDNTFLIEFIVEPIANHLTTIHPNNTNDNIFLTTITCLNDTCVSFFFTDITMDDYKYKSFDKTGLHLVSSNKMTHMCFSPNYIYGSICENSTYVNYTLKINFVKNQPIGSIYYNQPPALTIKYQRYLINSNAVLCKTQEVNNILTYGLFNSLLYDIDTYYKYKQSLSFDGFNHWMNLIDEQNMNAKNIQSDISNIKSVDIRFNNRFLQRFLFSSYLQKEYAMNIFPLNRHYDNEHDDGGKFRNIKVDQFNAPFFKLILSKVDSCYNLNMTDLSLTTKTIKHSNQMQSIQCEQDCDIIAYYLIEGSITFEFCDNVKTGINSGDLLILSGRMQYKTRMVNTNCFLLCVEITIPSEVL